MCPEWHQDGQVAICQGISQDVVFQSSLMECENPSEKLMPPAPALSSPEVAERRLLTWCMSWHQEARCVDVAATAGGQRAEDGSRKGSKCRLRHTPLPCTLLFDPSPTGAQWEGREECEGRILEGLRSYSEETEFHTGKAELSFFYFFIFFIYGCVGSSFLCEGFLQLWQAGATLHRGAWASHYRGLSCCGAQAPDAQAQ